MLAFIIIGLKLVCFYSTCRTKIPHFSPKNTAIFVPAKNQLCWKLYFYIFQLEENQKTGGFWSKIIQKIAKTLKIEGVSNKNIAFLPKNAFCICENWCFTQTIFFKISFDKDDVLSFIFMQSVPYRVGICWHHVTHVISAWVHFDLDLSRLSSVRQSSWLLFYNNCSEKRSKVVESENLVKILTP